MAVGSNLKEPDFVKDGIGVLWGLPAAPSELTSKSLTWTADVLARLLYYYGADVGGMISSHSLDSVFFGLLHYDDASQPSWNAYDESDPRLR